MTNEKAIEILKGAIKKPNTKDEYLGQAIDMAIKALEQTELNSSYNGVNTELDCISREAVEKITWEESSYTDALNVLTEVREKVRALPSVTPKAEWIPCSERLPKENEYIGDVCKYYLVQDEYGDMHVAHLSNVGWMPMDSLKAIGDEVIAWMPLPEPYKVESEE